MRTHIILSALVLAALSSACGRCNSDTPTTTSSGPTANAVDAAVPTPYLPARSAPDDSPAPVSMVEPVLFSLRPGLNLCYRVASHANPNLFAKAVFAVTIGGNGRVTEVSLVSSETQLAPDLVECVKRVLAQGDFKPTPDGGLATVAVPIAFRPPPGGWTDASR